jgi:NurA-like 5'-3' nuclease
MSTRYDLIAEYRKNLEEEIFACMERSGQSYIDICMMPVKRLENYLRWKAKLEEEKQKLIDEEMKKNH